MPVIVTNIQLVAQSDNFKADTDELIRKSNDFNELIFN